MEILIIFMKILEMEKMEFKLVKNYLGRPRLYLVLEITD